MAKFYTFRQNNSGGHFDVDDKVAHVVIIQATDASDANDRAERLGIYFDGVDAGRDCPCCGDRWYKAYTHGDEDDGDDEPNVDGLSLTEYFIHRWSRGYTVRLYLMDGTKITMKNERAV